MCFSNQLALDFKGLSRAPRIVPLEYGITARNIGALVAPLHSLGVATLAAVNRASPLLLLGAIRAKQFYP